jgi:hypothetical protein
LDRHVPEDVFGHVSTKVQNDSSELEVLRVLTLVEEPEDQDLFLHGDVVDDVLTDDETATTNKEFCSLSASLWLRAERIHRV